MATRPVTRLLLERSVRNEFAVEQLTPLVYHELRKPTGKYLSRERIGHTLQPTALVDAAYVRLVEQDHEIWESRSHFFGLAARLMRLIRRAALLRGNDGGGDRTLSLHIHSHGRSPFAQLWLRREMKGHAMK